MDLQLTPSPSPPVPQTPNTNTHASEEVDTISETNHQDLSNSIQSLIKSAVKPTKGKGNQRKHVDLTPPTYPAKFDAHWDYVLKEMAWMANDFKQEKLWKVKKMKMCSKEALKVQKRISESLKRKNKPKVAHGDSHKLRRIANNISRNVKKQFWDKIDRIVFFKHNSEFFNKQQQQLDKQLDFLVGQTERYSKVLSERLSSTTVTATKSISKTKRMEKNTVSILKKDASSNISSDKSPKKTVRFSLPSDYEGSDSESELPDGEWKGNIDEQDDEETIEQEEANDDEDDHEDELKLLQEEGELSIEELKARYASQPDNDIYKEMEEKPKKRGRKNRDQNQLEDSHPRYRKRSRRVYDDFDGRPPPEIENNENSEESMETSILNSELYGTDIAATNNSKEQESEVIEQEDGEWQGDVDEVDDEETIEQEEAEEHSDDGDELKLLQQENELSIEELRARYSGEPPNPIDSELKSNNNEDENSSESESSDEDKQDNDREWDGNKDEVDDEETIEAEEADENPDDQKEELKLLKEENEMSIEELRAKYSGNPDGDIEHQGNEDDREGSEEEDSNDNDEDEHEDDEWQGNKDEPDDEETIEQEEANKDEEEEKEELKKLQEESEISIEELRKRYSGEPSEDPDSSESESESMDIESPSDQREISTSVEENSPDTDPDSVDNRVKVPFLFPKDMNLREYQLMGMEWLISMHDRQLNGILADEMGLGKTIQTIALLAHLAGEEGIWGPHLIVVPTSVLLNWEMEFKRWCPGFKILTYYGTVKERKEKRNGWTKQNAFHVCITSYQLAVQDSAALKRKKWYYMILDEAHNIKNFQSQRWQTLLNFNTKRRLLLSGTPLQNSLMELWSLMHFLMPHVFRSQQEFKIWFSNPLNQMVEKGDKFSKNGALLKGDVGNSDEHNEEENTPLIIKRLHSVLRPFILRRLKSDVAKQLPEKHEHIVYVPLARRQKYLYEEFMSRTSTRQALKSGNYLGMMQVLMKLRMVCNHPDLFEPRVISSPFITTPIPLEAMYPESAYLYLDSPFSVKASLLNSLAIAGEYFSFPQREYHDKICNNSNNDISKLSDIFNDIYKSARNNVEDWFKKEKSKYEKLFGADESLFLNDSLTRKRNDLMNNKFEELVGANHRNLKLSARRLDSTAIYGNSLLTMCDIHSGSEMDYISGRKRLKLVNHIDIYGASIHHQDNIFLDPSNENNIYVHRLHKYSNAKVLEDAIIHSPEERLQDMRSILERYVIRPPKVKGSVSFPKVQDIISKDDEAFGESKRDTFHEIDIRQTLNFPDKMLVQYDCGKLQVLSTMLRDFKQNGHRVLIFTQMSKMLDILEIFLNLHGYTYFRLDGSTKIEDRQIMMERYNRDSRIFAFILSTRSGGLGINLVGADTVIFYDSDWNPSMDAQAQDRAHRIGQTREVNIYRLVSEHTIEENILLKAYQKRHLNKLSLEDGKFTVDSFFAQTSEESIQHAIEDSLNGQGSVLKSDGDIDSTDPDFSAAIAAVEDDQDREASQMAQKEVSEEVAEFDESKAISSSHGDEDQSEISPESQLPSNSSPINKDKDENEIIDADGNLTMTKSQFDSLATSLRPIDIYAIEFRTNWFPAVDPAKTAKALEKLTTQTIPTNEWDIEKIEQEKETMEEEGDEELIEANDMTQYRSSMVSSVVNKERFNEARYKIRMEKLLSKVTGSNWEKHFLEDLPTIPYYFNYETRESSFEPPSIFVAQEKFKDAYLGYRFLPAETILVRIFQYLLPYEQKLICARVCRRWLEASMNPRLCIWICPRLLGFNGKLDGPRPFSSASNQNQSSSIGSNSSADRRSDQLKETELTEEDNKPRYQWFTVGTKVEALYLEGEIWYPGSIIRARSDGTYDVLFTDGEIEESIHPKNIQLDRGGRYTLILPVDPKQAKYSTFNKDHSSRFGCGANAPDPIILTSIEELSKFSEDRQTKGQVVVLSAGSHVILTDKSINLPNGIKLISEPAYAERYNLAKHVRSYSGRNLGDKPEHYIVATKEGNKNQQPNSSSGNKHSMQGSSLVFHSLSGCMQLDSSNVVIERIHLALAKSEIKLDSTIDALVSVSNSKLTMLHTTIDVSGCASPPKAAIRIGNRSRVQIIDSLLMNHHSNESYGVKDVKAIVIGQDSYLELLQSSISDRSWRCGIHIADKATIIIKKSLIEPENGVDCERNAIITGEIVGNHISKTTELKVTQFKLKVFSMPTIESVGEIGYHYKPVSCMEVRGSPKERYSKKRDRKFVHRDTKTRKKSKIRNNFQSI